MPDMDLATMARDLLMLNPKLMLTPTFFMVDMDSDMLDTIILPMDMLLIMARGLLMLSPRLMLILIFSMVDIVDLVMPAMVFTILPMVVMLTMERDLPMLNPRPMLTPSFFTVVMD